MQAQATRLAELEFVLALCQGIPELAEGALGPAQLRQVAVARLGPQEMHIKNVLQHFVRATEQQQGDQAVGPSRPISPGAASLAYFPLSKALEGIPPPGAANQKCRGVSVCNSSRKREQWWTGGSAY